MSPDQEKHLQALKQGFSDLVDMKYRRGATEHEGDLLSLDAEQLLIEAINENIDQFTYLMTALNKVKKL